MAEWFKLTNSKDNIPRLTLKVEYRLTLWDVAILLTVEEPEPKPFDQYVKLWPSRREALKSAENALYKRTLEGAYYYVGDNDLAETASSILQRLAPLWGVSAMDMATQIVSHSSMDENPEEA